MKVAGGILGLVMCAVVPAVSVDAQNAVKSTITGPPPYSLGMTTAEARAADPALSPLSATDSTPCTAAHSASYASRATARVSGYPYVADVVLCFIGDRLGAIYVKWPGDAFQEDTIAWQRATSSLAAQLAASYAPPLMRRYSVDETMGAVVEMADAQGNLLTMTSNTGNNANIALVYMSAAYDQAVNGKHISFATY